MKDFHLDFAISQSAGSLLRKKCVLIAVQVGSRVLLTKESALIGGAMRKNELFEQSAARKLDNEIDLKINANELEPLAHFTINLTDEEGTIHTNQTLIFGIKINDKIYKTIKNKDLELVGYGELYSIGERYEELENDTFYDENATNCSWINYDKAHGVVLKLVAKILINKQIKSTSTSSKLPNSTKHIDGKTTAQTKLDKKISKLKSTPKPAGDSIISLLNVSKNYKVGGVKISQIKNISLEIVAGEIVALFGPDNSSSTLLHLISGVDRPSAGDIIINNENLNKIRSQQLPDWRSRTIGFITKTPYLQPQLNARRNIELAAQMRNPNPERTNELARQTGLNDCLNQPVKTLSSEQQQRVVIARALLNKPKIVLVDESTSELNPAENQAAVDLLLKLCKDIGATVIIATQNKITAAQASRIFTINNGELA